MIDDKNSTRTRFFVGKDAADHFLTSAINDMIWIDLLIEPDMNGAYSRLRE